MFDSLGAARSAGNARIGYDSNSQRTSSEVMLAVEALKPEMGSQKSLILSSDLARLQCDQHKHDMRNHFDIASLHKTDRLKHYGLHFAKYVGRLAREAVEDKPIERTLTDAFLVSLSAANTLHQDLSKESFSPSRLVRIGCWLAFADAAGRFADACEKIDHMEEFVPLAREANLDIVNWIFCAVCERGLDLKKGVSSRRKELMARQFYIHD